MKYQYWIEEKEEIVVYYSDTIPPSYIRIFELGENGNYWEIFP